MSERRKFTLFHAGDHVVVQNPKSWDVCTNHPGQHEFIVESVQAHPNNHEDHAYLPTDTCTRTHCLHVYTHPQLLQLEGKSGFSDGSWFDPLIQQEYEKISEIFDRKVANVLSRR
jgi:hypothetical protein